MSEAALAAPARRPWLRLAARPGGLAGPLLLIAALALLPFLAAAFGETHYLALASRIAIYAVAALSLDLVLGYGGMVSFGQAAFLGLGAYAVGIAAAHGLDEAALTLPLAIAAAAGFAALTGAVAVRTTGVHFIMITLAFGQMAYFTASSLSPYGGDDGLTVPGRSRVFGTGLLDDPAAFHLACCAALAGAYLLARRIAGSRFGRVLRASAENPVRTASLGFPVNRVRLAAYTVSGGIGGLAGFLLANATEFVAPAYMTWQRSGELIVMVILGGLGSLHGAILGAVAFIALEEGLSGLTQHWKMILGPLLVLVALYARGGLLGALTRLTGARRG